MIVHVEDERFDCLWFSVNLWDVDNDQFEDIELAKSNSESDRERFELLPDEEQDGLKDCANDLGREVRREAIRDSK